MAGFPIPPLFDVPDEGKPWEFLDEIYFVKAVGLLNTHVKEPS